MGAEAPTSYADTSATVIAFFLNRFRPSSHRRWKPTAFSRYRESHGVTLWSHNRCPINIWPIPTCNSCCALQPMIMMHSNSLSNVPPGSVDWFFLSPWPGSVRRRRPRSGRFSPHLPSTRSVHGTRSIFHCCFALPAIWQATSNAARLAKKKLNSRLATPDRISSRPNNWSPKDRL